MKRSYLFYDIETTGLNKSLDQIIQFAAIRTDILLNEIERHEFFVKLNVDVVPSPKAFITHRVPLSRLKNGLNEVDAIHKIHQLVNQPGTISIGYNTLGFDDEFLRFSFYRNLLPPYTHQYANNCSRMDLYPITVMFYLYQPHVIKWPENNLKLENISKENSLESGMAHNAMVDVAATLKLARCFQQEKATWEYLTGYFDKQIDQTRCLAATTANGEFPLGLMIDGKLGYRQQYQSAVVSLGNHHHYKNQSLWLRLDTEQLMQATEGNFLEQTWVINKKMGEPAWILPMKQRYLKSYLLEKNAHIQETISWLQQNKSLVTKIENHFRDFQYPKINNLSVDASLYDFGFASHQDQHLCRLIHQASPTDKVHYAEKFQSAHLKEIFKRMMARHFPECLDERDREEFQQYFDFIKSCSEQEFYLDHRGAKRYTPKQALQDIETLHQESLDEEQLKILRELKDYIHEHFV